MPAGTVSFSRSSFDHRRAARVRIRHTIISVAARGVSERQKAGPAGGATRRTRNRMVDRDRPRREPRHHARSAILAVGGKLGRSLPGISSQVATCPMRLSPNLPRTMRSNGSRSIALPSARPSGRGRRWGPRRSSSSARRRRASASRWSTPASRTTTTSQTSSGPQRVDRFVDFLGGGAPYDDYGHGTTSRASSPATDYDSDGRRTGIAPAARLIVLKVLDGGQRPRQRCGRGHRVRGRHRDELNIRVINLSIATPCTNRTNRPAHDRDTPRGGGRDRRRRSRGQQRRQP